MAYNTIVACIFVVCTKASIALSWMPLFARMPIGDTSLQEHGTSSQSQCLIILSSDISMNLATAGIIASVLREAYLHCLPQIRSISINMDTDSISMSSNSSQLSYQRSSMLGSTALAELSPFIYTLELPSSYVILPKEVYRAAYNAGYHKKLDKPILITGCLHVLRIVAKEMCPTLEEIAAVTGVSMEDATKGAEVIGEFFEERRAKVGQGLVKCEEGHRGGGWRNKVVRVTRFRLW